MSVEIIASDKERYIRVAAIDIVSSEGIRNICFMKRYIRNQHRPAIVSNMDIRYSGHLTSNATSSDQYSALLINENKEITVQK